MIRDGSGKMKGRHNHRRSIELHLVNPEDVRFLDRYTRRAIADNLLRVQRATDRAGFETLMMGRPIEDLPFI